MVEEKGKDVVNMKVKWWWATRKERMNLAQNMGEDKKTTRLQSRNVMVCDEDLKGGNERGIRPRKNNFRVAKIPCCSK